MIIIYLIPYHGHNDPPHFLTLISSFSIAFTTSSTILNPNLLANLTQRSTRSGSSRKVSKAESGVRMRPAARSGRPCNNVIGHEYG